MDSNHRRRQPTDLQSAPFSHSGISPIESRRWDSNPQPADYKSAALPIELLRRINNSFYTVPRFTVRGLYFISFLKSTTFFKNILFILKYGTIADSRTIKEELIQKNVQVHFTCQRNFSD